MGSTERLQRALDYQFSDPSLLALALTHRSAAGANNERLEFLGDSVLNHIIAEALFQHFPRSREGEMSRMRASLVKGETLTEIARDLELGAYLQLGSGERKSGGHRRDSILADALEAVLGAILLDGDIEQCRRCVLQLYAQRLEDLTGQTHPKDAKTSLQEYLQGRGLPLPEYEVSSTQGKDHARQFNITCRMSQPTLQAGGTGSSVRKAEQDAAANALAMLLSDGR